MPRHITQSLKRIADRRITMSVAGVCVALGVFPIIAALVLSLCSVDAGGLFHFGSLDGYRALIGGGRLEEYRKILLRSVVVTIATMLVTTPTAYWIARIKHFSVRITVLGLLLAPWFVSDMLRAFGWQILLSPVGPISSLWNILTHSGPVEGLRYNFYAVVIALVSSMLPVGVLSVLASLPDGYGSEWLAATELGSPRQTFSLLIFGRAKIGIALGACFVFLLSMFSSAEARFLDGPTETSIQSVESSLANDGVPALLAFGTSLVFCVLATICLLGIVYLFFRRITTPRSPEQTLRSCVERPSRWKHHVSKAFIGEALDIGTRYGPFLAGAVSLVLCLAPMTAVATQAFLQPSRNGMIWTSDNFRLMLSSDQLRDAMLNSTLVGFIVAGVTAVLAFALSLATWDTAIRPRVLFLLGGLALLPGDSYAIGLLQLLKRFGVADGGWSLLVLSHVLWALPFATGTLLLANERVGAGLLEAALEYGNGPWEVIARVLGRIQFPQIAGVALLAAMLSLNEYVRASYLGASLITVSNEVHGRLTSGLQAQDRGVFAAEFLISCGSLITVLLILTLMRSPFFGKLSGSRQIDEIL